MPLPSKRVIRWRLECTWEREERWVYEVSSYPTEAEACAAQAERARTGVVQGKPWDRLVITPYVLKEEHAL